jgi:hypothetical protein
MPVIESKKRNSILGSLALLVGLGAIGLSAIDIGGLPPVNVGPWMLPFALALDLGVGALAVISLLLAGKSRRTGTELPMAALVVAVGATAIFYFRHRTPPAPVKQVTPTMTPATTVQTPAVNAKLAAKVPDHPIVAPSVSNAASAARNVTEQGTAMLARQQRASELHNARAQFAAAQAQVIQSLQSDPAYRKAKADSDAADEQLRTARLQYQPGDSNLVAFSQTALKARDALNQLVAQADTKDSTAAAAKAKLDAIMQQHQP